jgi:hypothetical protein
MCMPAPGSTLSGARAVSTSSRVYTVPIFKPEQLAGHFEVCYTTWNHPPSFFPQSHLSSFKSGTRALLIRTSESLFSMQSCQSNYDTLSFPGACLGPSAASSWHAEALPIVELAAA